MDERKAAKLTQAQLADRLWKPQSYVAKYEGGEAGDIWTWTAIDADTKLIASWLERDRSGATTRIFVDNLANRLASRIHQTTRVTLAMAAGVTTTLWEIADIVRIVDEWEFRQKDEKNAER